MRPRSRALVLLLTVALLPAAHARAQGVVGLLNKERKVAPQPALVILGETLDSVRFRTKAGERTEKTADIAWIEYGPGSPAYEKARVTLQSGDLQNAEALFASAASDSDPPWVAAHALLQQAEVAERRGKDGLPAAREALAAFLKRFPDHRLLPQALLDQARLQAIAGEQAAVDASVAAALKLVTDGRVSPEWAVRAHLMAGELRLSGGSAAGARLAYAEAEKAAKVGRDKVATDRPDLVPVLDGLALQARVGTASCLLATDDVTGARTLYQQLAREGQGDVAVKAAADNGLAECDFRDPARLKDAQLGFARVAVAAAGVPVERARALYFLGRCADELGKLKREPDGHARATAYFEEVVKRYPDTPWARRAEESLR